MAASQNIVMVEVRIARVAAGTAAVLVQQEQSNNPGQGQTPLSILMPMDQFLFEQDAEQIYGTDGAITLAQIRTALVAAADAIAGSSGTPRLSAADLAKINAWATGGP